MRPRPFRGILGAALLLAGLGPDLQPPPRPREPEPEPEPEPTTAELDAMHAALTEAGIDAGRLAADVRGWPAELMRRGRIELTTRDLTTAGVADLDKNRAALEQATGLTYDEHAALLKRVKARVSESVFTARQLREAGVTMTPGLPDDMRLRVGKGLTISRDGELVEITEPSDLRVGFKVDPASPPETASGEGKLVHAGLDGSIDLSGFKPGERVTVKTPEGATLATVVIPAAGSPAISTTRLPRGPGLQIRDVRERRGMSLRDLAARLEIPVVELGEYERNFRPVGPELWAKARTVLPALPETMPPETALPRSFTGTERLVLNVDASLHPAGRCTCAGEGQCEWCVMDQRRAAKAAEKPARKRETRRTKQARKARRGW